MKRTTRERLFAKGVMHALLPELQETARKNGQEREVTLDEKRGETRVGCKIIGDKIVPNVDNFIPQAINFGLPCLPGTASLVIETKEAVKVFKPRMVGDKAFLFFRNAVVFNLWQRQLEVIYISARFDAGENQWHLVLHEIFLYTIPSFIMMNDAGMREFLKKELRGKLPETYFGALDELTLNPTIPEREHRADPSQQELAGKQAALLKSGNNRRD